jgi:hypothetical protein
MVIVFSFFDGKDTKKNNNFQTFSQKSRSPVWALRYSLLIPWKWPKKLYLCFDKNSETVNRTEYED